LVSVGATRNGRISRPQSRRGISKVGGRTDATTSAAPASKEALWPFGLLFDLVVVLFVVCFGLIPNLLGKMVKRKKVPPCGSIGNLVWDRWPPAARNEVTALPSFLRFRSLALRLLPLFY